jgi:hypothetical protein
MGQNVCLPAMPTEQPLSWQRCLHNGADLACEAASGRLLFEFEVNVCKSFLLLEYPLLRGRFPDKRNVLKKDLHNFFVILQPFFGESNLAVEYSWGPWTYWICSYNQRLAQVPHGCKIVNTVTRMT